MSNRDLNGKPRELPPNSNHFDAYPCNVEHYHTETNRMNVETDDPGSKLDEVGEGLEETNGDNLDKIKGPIDHGWAWVILVGRICNWTLKYCNHNNVVNLWLFTYQNFASLSDCRYNCDSVCFLRIHFIFSLNFDNSAVI